MTEQKRKMAELRGDGLDRLDQGLVSSVESCGAERLGQKRGRTRADQRGSAQNMTNTGAYETDTRTIG
jgi:hypothetical protein